MALYSRLRYAFLSAQVGESLLIPVLIPLLAKELGYTGDPWKALLSEALTMDPYSAYFSKSSEKAFEQIWVATGLDELYELTRISSSVEPWELTRVLLRKLCYDRSDLSALSGAIKREVLLFYKHLDEQAP